MDRRGAALLAGALVALGCCVLAAVVPGAATFGDLAVAATGVMTGAILWLVGGRRERGLRGWRLLALAPLFPAAAVVVSLLAHALNASPLTPVQLILLRWLPTVPGYAVGIVGLLTLAGGRRLWSGNVRGVVELALFLVACLVVVQLVVVGPSGSWWALGPGERFVLSAAVVVTSATTAAALTLLGAVEPRRQPMAGVLLGGAGLLTAGRAVQTAALLSGRTAGVDGSRFLLIGGLGLMVLALLLDVTARSGQAPPLHRVSRLSELLPHAAMVVATTVLAGAAVVGHPPSAVSYAGLVLCVVLSAVHRWVSARDEHRMGARLQHSEAYFRSLVHSAGDAVLILDGALKINWASTAFLLLLGTRDPAGRELTDLVHPDDVAAITATLAARTADGGGTLLTFRTRDADGRWRDLEAAVSDLRGDAAVRAVVLHCRDVTDRVRREWELARAAWTEPVTELPNRAACAAELGRALAARTAGEDAAPATLLLVELEGLDRIRVEAHRGVAASAVGEVGRRLRGTVREADLIARMGDRMFAVLAVGAPEEIERLAARCLAVVEQPIATPVGIFDLTARVGMAALDSGLDTEELLDRADLALVAARSAGPGIARWYTAALGADAERRGRLREDLRSAVARGELTLVYQPVVALADHRVAGLHAQLRWRHTELGEIPPAEFLPIAEAANLIGQLQRWALETATAEVAALPPADPPLRLGVGVTSRYVAGGTLVDDVAGALRASCLPPQRLVVEIPEATLVAAAAQLTDDVSALRLMGVRVTVTNFGTGHTPLAELTQVPIDILKFDRSFVGRIDRDPQSRALLESVMGIGHALGLDVCAEGVETAAQLTVLRGLGCGLAQGALLSRPLTPTQLRTVLADGAGELWPGLIGSSS